MRALNSSLAFSLAAATLLAALAGTPQVHAAPNALAEPEPHIDSDSYFRVRRADSDILVARQGHDHAHGHGHAAPLLELNETDILRFHEPSPPSYGTHDFEDPDVEHKYPYLMGLHALFMGAAFFGALPIGIALRSVKHGMHGISVAVFYGLITLGLSCSALYKKLTPNMYEGAKHGPQGYFVIAFAILLTTIDALAALARLFTFVRQVRNGERQLSIKGFWNHVILNRIDDSRLGYSNTYAAAHEYTGLVTEPEEFVSEFKAAGHFDHIDTDSAQTDSGVQSPTSEDGPSDLWSNDIRVINGRHRSRQSAWRHSIASDGTLFSARQDSRHSDETLHELPPHVPAAQPPLMQRIRHGAFATAERVLVFMGYMQLLTGIVTYTGVCRNNWVNGCLAHLIKGGIFWCYGLVTFARFLGSFSELGWAWNRSPLAEKVPSAEFVESLVIFLYGISNTWMERFGVPAGAPFSTKQIQHISIAIMFWFAGLVGMGIESKTIRKWLAAPASALSPPLPAGQSPAQPVSYRASFNPFPALVIGVTGLAMAAHAQVYLFQVQIHMLWGQLLAGFALLRCLTYFFLWLSPPTSIFPSRPPTEALASFFLACGGLVFQLSLEELNIAAMRRGHDDVMMFLNFAVAVTCLAFCWTLAVVTFKAWLKTRQTATLKRNTSA